MARKKITEAGRTAENTAQNTQENVQATKEQEGDKDTAMQEGAGQTAESAPKNAAQDTPEQEGDKDTTGGGDSAKSGEKKPEQDIFANLPSPCVYCGPTVRGVARQYTTYQGGGIPDELREFIKAHPAARGLLVSTAKFASVRKRLDTPGTAEAILFKKVKSQL